MAIQTINIGTGELTGDGETLRSAFNKINQNFIEVSTSTIDKSLLPAVNLTYDLGSTSSQWRSLYVGTSTIYLGGNALSVIDGNLSLNGSSAAGLGQFKISGNNLGTVDNPNTGGWGGYDMYIDPGNGSNAFIYIPGVPNQAASTNLQISNNSTAGAIQLFGRGGVQVVVNHGVNEKVFEFADNGSLIFPNSTIQSSAWTGSTSTLVNGTYTVQLLVDGNLTLPGEIHGKQLYGFGGTPNGRAVNITPASNASDKKFSLRVDQYGETFTRAYLDMPTAQNNKQVAISFAHQNNTVGYIFNQGADTFDDGLNNAFNIFYNAGDIKLTAMTTGTGVFRTWKFGQSGGLTSPDGTTSTGASVHVPYATSSSYKITTEIDMLGSYMPLTFEVIGDTIKLPSGNGRIQSGNFLNAWSLDSLNKSFTFPNNSDIEYGEGTYLSTGSLRVRVDFGGEFKIFLSQPNKTWTFNNTGDLQLPGKIVGYDPGGFQYERVSLQGSPSVDKNLHFYVAHTSGVFDRSELVLPDAEINKFVSVQFPHSNGTSGYIFNQGNDTLVNTDLNNALNIMMNTGSVKITTLDQGPTRKTWEFKTNGNLLFPDGTSQITAFTTSASLHKILNLKSVSESFSTVTGSSGVVSHDISSGSIFYHTNINSNFVANFVNLNLSSNNATNITLIINQTATSFVTTGVQISGVSQTINWQGSTTAPTGTANKIEVISFSILNNNGSYIIFGQLSSFG